ncbi:MAG: efflux RND transporter periplasmic adaptor subunit [Polyangiales bacterium]
MNSSRLRTVTWICALLLAGGGAYTYYRHGKASKSQDLKLDTAAVDRGPVVSKVTATGTLSALVTVQVGSQVSGRVQEIRVDFNSAVKKGQVIAKIDPQLFRAALEQGRANYTAAKANVAKSEVQAMDADRQAVRARSLAEQKLGPQADADTTEAAAAAAKAQIDASRAAVAQAEAALHQAQVNLDYTTIISPINGTVISRNVDVGQTVAASLAAPTLFVIAEDLRKMQVDSSVSEADVGKLRSGMDAMFTVDAYPGDRFRGTIRQIRNAPQTLQNVVTYDAVIDVDNTELKLRPGMTAAVTFVSASRDDALRVPNAALRFRPTPDVVARLRGEPAGKTAGARPAAGAAQPRGGGIASRGVRPSTREPSSRAVWVMRGDKPQEVTIRTGISDGTVTEVLEGALTAGDKVVTDAPEGAGAKGGAARNPLRMF